MGKIVKLQDDKEPSLPDLFCRIANDAPKFTDVKRFVDFVYEQLKSRWRPNYVLRLVTRNHKNKAETAATIFRICRVLYTEPPASFFKTEKARMVFYARSKRVGKDAVHELFRLATIGRLILSTEWDDAKVQSAIEKDTFLAWQPLIRALVNSHDSELEMMVRNHAEEDFFDALNECIKRKKRALWRSEDLEVVPTKYTHPLLNALEWFLFISPDSLQYLAVAAGDDVSGDAVFAAVEASNRDLQSLKRQSRQMSLACFYINSAGDGRGNAFLLQRNIDGRLQVGDDICGDEWVPIMKFWKERA